MNTQQTGRIIGGLLLLQFVVGVLNFQVLTAPLFAEGGYLPNAAAHTQQLGISVLLTIAGGLISLSIVALAYPLLQVRGRFLALLYLLLSVVVVALGAVEQAGILTMREFSSQYLAADTANRAAIDGLAVAGSALRNGMHYIGLMTAGLAMGVWYLCMLRFKLLPAAIAVLGLLAVGLQLFSISLPILGGSVNFALLAPLGLTQLLQCGWLLLFGFRPEDAS